MPVLLPTRREHRRFTRFIATARRPPLGAPFRPSPVENGNRVMPRVPQHPPQSAGEYAAVLVVRNYLYVATNAKPPEGGRHRLESGQWVPPIRAGRRG